jgi:hypothetical protein
MRVIYDKAIIKRGGEMQVPLADAIQQLRDELREAILGGRDKDIVFTPNEIELELGINFTAEAIAGGGFKDQVGWRLLRRAAGQR